MVVFLIGFMGCGKSYLGRTLAARLGWELVDMDSEIERRCGMKIAEIFERHGEEYFRERERELLHELSERKRVVVSAGGGAPVHGDNMETMNRAGLTIYLKMSPSNLAKRLERGMDKRPLIRDLTPGQLLAFIETRLPEREQWYARAKATVDCNGADAQYLAGHAITLIENYDITVQKRK
ncbi:MAG: shikimate kinase [Rikenellaceae bacterium]|jgi:shikimate kinase|nr:shikimate kinase [Rikenellaceae bacterium]